MKYKKKNIESGILGLIIGDVLGVPHEFKPRSYFDDYPVIDMIGYGTHYQPKGTWSDDSSLTLISYESIINNESYSQMKNKFVEWLDDGYMTPHGEVFDVGGTTLRSIHRIKEGKEYSGECEFTSNGNGSLMRILPFALKREDLKFEDIVKASSITHAHPISYLSCFFYLELVGYLLDGVGKEESLELCLNKLKEVIVNYENPTYQELMKLLEIDFVNANLDEIRSGTYVIDTLIASIFCLLRTSNYKEAILMAVNMGGDTDTTAAVTGGIAGIYYGKDAIPKKWIEDLVKNKLIENIIEKAK